MKPNEAFQSVKIEIVRPGDPHNQLLSPVTQYVALCGDQRPATVHVRWEQRRWLRALRALRYQRGAEPADRAWALQEAQAEVTHLLSQVPALATEAGAERPLCIRLVLTPAELAMLPFEAALAPPGLPGDGRELLLASDHPVVMTREVRSGSPREVTWPSELRVLVVAARPEGFGPIPLDAHLLALRRACQPWEGPGRPDAGAPGRVEPLLLDHAGRPLLAVLQQATLDALRQAIIEGAGEGRPWTHLHVLAHGAELGEERYGLALCDASGQPHVVDGEQLAKAVRARVARPGPSCVVLATCDSGGTRDVMYPAVHLAHALHVDGVPLVVGSQLPLTARGSVRLTTTLYEGLLAGWDPLWALTMARRELFRHRDESHDWASVVAYTRLPNDHNHQVSMVRFDRNKERLWAASAWASPGRGGDLTAADARMAEAIDRMRRWEADERGWIDASPQRRVELAGRHGGALRRRGQLVVEGVPAERALESGEIEDCRRFLRSAKRIYRTAVDVSPHHPWTTGQFIAIGALLDQRDDDDLVLWRVAWRAVSLAPPRSRWEAADHLELVLLAAWLGVSVDPLVERRALTLLQEDAEVDLARIHRGHLERYATLWSRLPHADPGWVRLQAEASRLAALVPV